MAWPMRRLGDLLTLEYGKPLPESDRDPHGVVPAFGANGVLCRTNKSYDDGPSIIVGRKGSAGEVTLVEEPFWPTDVTYFLRHDEAVTDLRYLYYLLLFLDLPSLAKGVKPGINRSDVYALSAVCPPLREQKRIVTILDEAFEGIRIATANAEKNLANARELFESERDGVFEREGDDWRSAPLGELVSIKHGFAFKSEYFDDAGPHVLLTPGNFYEKGGYRDRGAKQKFYKGPIPDGFVLSAGDMLLAMTEQAAGLLGSPMIVPDQGSFLHNQRLGLVQPKRGAPWNSKFFEHTFNTKRFRARVHRDASGVKVRHTSPERLCSIEVVFPDTEKAQSRIADRLSDLASETQRLGVTYEQRLAMLEDAKQSILSRALSGQLTATKGLAA